MTEFWHFNGGSVSNMTKNAFQSSAFVLALITFTTIGTDSASGAPDNLATTSLREYKNSVVLDLKVSQSRIFNTRGTIVRTCVSDFDIAEPVVIARDQIILLGKAPGRTTLTIWDVDGPMVGIEVQVTRDPAEPDHGLSNKKSATAMPYMAVGTVDLKECKMTTEATAQLEHSKAKNSSTPPKSAPPRTPPAGTPSQECKTSLVIDLEPSQFRTFRMPHRIVKTSISDPAVAEPIILAPTNDLEVRGKAPGRATLSVIDDTHKELGIELRVSSSESHGQANVGKPAETPIPHVVTGTIYMNEYKIGRVIDLELTRPKMFKVKKTISRVSISDPAIAELLPGDDAVYLVGKGPGAATLFIWDGDAHVSGIHLRVGKDPGHNTSASLTSASLPPPGATSRSVMEIEYWAADKRSTRRWP